MDCDTSYSKQRNFDEIFNKMTSWREHPAENLENRGDDRERERLRACAALPVEQVCRYSQLHLNVKHDHDHEHDCHTTLRHQPTHDGLALCHRVILDSVTPPWVSERTPTVHGGPHAGRPWVARQQVTTYDTTSKGNTTKTGLSQTCFQETSVDTHLETCRFWQFDVLRERTPFLTTVNNCNSRLLGHRVLFFTFCLAVHCCLNDETPFCHPIYILNSTCL